MFLHLVTVFFVTIPDLEERRKARAAKFSKTLDDVTASEAGVLELCCKVQGDPLPDAEWFHGDSPLRNEGNNIVMTSADSVTLKVMNVSQTNAGKYTCKIKVCRKSMKKHDLKRRRPSFSFLEPVRVVRVQL